MEKEILDDVNSEKADETQTVGDILRHARLKQGKTLSDVADDLCIRRVYLEAIENVEYKKLPVEPYGLGYVRNYAEYLGLNSARIVQSFKETAMPKTHSKKDLKAIGDKQESNSPHLKHVIIGLFLFIAAIFGWKFYNQYSSIPMVEFINDTPVDENYPTPVILEEDNSDESITTDEALENQDEENSQDAAEVDNQETEIEEVEQSEDNTPRIKIVVLGDSWIELKHGNEVLLAKVYNKGFEYEVPYNENLQVSVGKRHNVQFYIDGKLTEVTAPRKQMRIELDKFLEKRQ